MRLASRIILVSILALSLGLMVFSSLQESAIMDELAHIPAGYSYLNNLDYRLNPEHPPLVKMAAGLPLLFLDLNFPTDDPAWSEKVNGQWDMGSTFLYWAGNDADQIIQWARTGPMVLTLILIIFVYIWSKELMGDWWALLPSIGVALSPHFLAHGHYVTTDVGAALGIVVSLYYFNRYLTFPNKKSLIIAGLAFGFAQLTKFSALILVGHMLIMVVIYALLRFNKDKHEIKHAFVLVFTYLRRLFIIFAIGALVIYPLYALASINNPPERQLSDTTTIIGTNFENPPLSYLADATIWLSDKPILRPYAQYLLGVLMVFKRSSESNTLYFMGDVDTVGGPGYFPTIYALKETLPMLILVGLGIIFAIFAAIKALFRRTPTISEYLNTNLDEFSAMLFVSIYVLYSIISPLNIGLRHLIPILPLIYILATGVLRKHAQKDEYKKQLKSAMVVFLFIWQGAIALTAFPNYLPYFNDFVGTDNGWRYATDSNYDWGQDLKRLVTFVKENNIQKIGIHNFGGGSPQYYMGDKAIPWYPAFGNPIENGIEWMAISVNELQNATAPTAPGFIRDIEKEYRWLDNPTSPDFIVGKSIFVYRLSD
ncbi:MAG: glycosyltransferase family 39 protein [Candidatus Colwellbacteria bacterium]|nr:glycosyltransferase family 39 protein [Candidatus Colwellbacteria bacterium]